MKTAIFKLYVAQKSECSNRLEVSNTSQLLDKFKIYGNWVVKQCMICKNCDLLHDLASQNIQTNVRSITCKSKILTTLKKNILGAFFVECVLVTYGESVIEKLHAGGVDKSCV